ncbi:hypothetical protein CMUST_00940 [Corynebacterium mustelae]|uniref:DUF5979 domain-containing protein n=1 Tax=Corynebacterium mustelae TaxID=571915 RepID=A0A0G3GTT5_9CORY|nr:DUF5979 domain-containing protein [Corynebacterium mustelae]AKK04539.1 hypothetical protein CMUST_00940 [Corynebacterium mustelae]
MGQLSLTNARTKVRAFVILMVFALVSSVIVVMPTGTANAQTGFVPKDFASQYGTNLEIKRDAKVITDSDEDNRPIVAGNEIDAIFEWEVGGNEAPRPGDQMIINLPSWLRTSTNRDDYNAGKYTTCDFKVTESQVICTFTDAVEGDNNANIKGHIGLRLKATPTTRAESLTWGPEKYDAFFDLTGERNGEIKAPGIGGDNAATGAIRKGGNFSKDLKYKDTDYQQLFWSVLIPAEKVNEIAAGNNNAIEIEDTLSDVQLVDPDTGEEVTVRHYFAAAGVGGNLEISRREGDSLANGTWEVTESPKCNAGGEYHSANIPCATRIAQANNETGEVAARSGQPEVITVDKYYGKNNWEPASKLKIKIENVKPNAAYRITYYTWIPSTSIGPDKGALKNPQAKNSIRISGHGETIVKDVALYARVWGDSSGDPNRTEIVVKKKVEAAPGETSDVKEFPLDLHVNGKVEKCSVSEEKPCKIMVDPGSNVKIVEPSVSGSALTWNPGVFSVPATQVNKQSDIKVSGNTATIERAVRGEKITLLLTNSFQPSVKYGQFVVKKIQQGLDPKGGTGPDLTAKEYSLKFQCDKDSKPVNGASAYKANTDYDITVTAKAEKLVGEFPAGTKCVIKDEDLASAKIKGPHANQTKEFEATASYVQAPEIKAGEKNVATVTNKYQNTFFLSKVVEGVPQELYQDKDFTFEYTCGTETGRVKLKANGKATMIPQFFDIGTRCTYKEVDLPEIPGYKLINVEKPYADGLSIVGAPRYHEKRVVNKYEKEIILGQFKLEKAVVGVDAAAIGNPEFKASASWTVNGKSEKRDVTVRAGQVVEDFPALPVGTVVTLSETRPADNAAVAWDTPVFSGDGVVDNGNGTADLTIKAGIVGGQVVTLTNNATPLGQFKLQKVVKGLGSYFVGDQEYKVSASWTANGKNETKDMTLRNGTVVDIPDLPVGTVVTLQELKPADSATATWATPVFSGDGVVDKGDGTAELTIKQGTADGQLVTLTNTVNPQWWWLLIGLVPLISGGLASLVPGPVAPLGQQPQAPAPQASTPAKPLGEAPQKGIAKDAPTAKGVQKDSQAKSLAKTGASVLGLVAIAALLAALGVFLVRRGRKS